MSQIEVLPDTDVLAAEAAPPNAGTDTVVSDMVPVAVSAAETDASHNEVANNGLTQLRP
jgi:alpha-ketoglutarate-dependent taurine dioxygenase